MKKLFVMLMLVLACGITAQAQNKWTIKAGIGASKFSDDDTDATFHFKIGAGYELRVNNLIGIEPNAFLVSKGISFDNWDGSDDDSWSPLYLEIPVMCNFHLSEHWVLGAGPYVGLMLSDDDWEAAKSTDYGLKIGAKYVFDSGINLGIDSTLGLTEAIKRYDDSQNITFAFCIGYSF